MNTEPHSHVVKLGAYGRVEYGDQSEYIRICAANHINYPWEPQWYTEWRIRRIVKKLIRKHDKASRKAALESSGDNIARRVIAEMQPTGTGWGAP